MRCRPVVLVAVVLLAGGCGSSAPAPERETDRATARKTPPPERAASREVPPKLIGDEHLLCMTRRKGMEDRLEGLSYTRAERMLRSTPCTLRMVALNGTARPITSDFLGTRINVAVRDGAIVRVDGLY